jgi:hypothetical protein
MSESAPTTTAIPATAAAVAAIPATAAAVAAEARTMAEPVTERKISALIVRTSDGHAVPVPVHALKKSKMLKTMSEMEDTHEPGEVQVSIEDLTLFFEFAEIDTSGIEMPTLKDPVKDKPSHLNIRKPPVDPFVEARIAENKEKKRIFTEKILARPLPRQMEVCTVFNYLDAEEGFLFLASTIADVVKAMPADSVRETLGLPNDMTPEMIEEFNAWVRKNWYV